MSKNLAQWRLAVVGLACTCLWACGSYYSEVTIINEGPSDVTGLVWTFEEVSITSDQIPAGARRTLYAHLPGEGASSLSFVRGQRRVSLNLCYHTGFQPMRGEILMRGDRILRRCH